MDLVEKLLVACLVLSIAAFVVLVGWLGYDCQQRASCRNSGGEVVTDECPETLFCSRMGCWPVKTCNWHCEAP